MSSLEFSDITIRITKQLSKTEKKEQGIFITPQTIIHKLWEHLEPLLEWNSGTKYRILEPSAGTGEIIRYLDNRIMGNVIDAVEKNKILFDSLKLCNMTQNEFRTFHQDFTSFKTEEKYDLVIGNPPYVVMKKEEIPNDYREYCIGRANLFGVFILHSISLLKRGGVLAFIIPKSFLNAAYYSEIRHFMKQTGDILNIIDFEKDNLFIDTQQSTFGILFRRTRDEDRDGGGVGGRVRGKDCAYSIKLGDSFVFNENVPELKQYLEGSTTLEAMGFIVKTGTIVWNQCKELLTSDSSQTRLIYNSNLSKDNQFENREFTNDSKKQYIRKKGSRENVIVVNRGNGNSSYSFHYALIEGDKIGEYLVENHLNVISFPCSDLAITPEEIRGKMNKLIESFQHPKTELFIRSFFGNGGLSKTELQTIFPIFLS
jgi:type I restriction-modification system DNA methylase subunit